jgi:formamidopyrimidine-DNA glycosylase
MPELPEVETTRRGIEPHVKDRTVVGVRVREYRLRWPVSENLAQSLTGQRITSVRRRAKYLFLDSSRGSVMIHLGMSGSLRILARGAPPGKHDHVDIILDSDRLVRYRDPRRFGSLFWIEKGAGHPLLEALGPEPLEEDFSGEYLYRVSRGRRVAVKSLLMTNRVVVGIGNIYANEALFAAGIRPDRSAGRISRQRYEKLAAAVKAVLLGAIEAGGTTLRDFVREDGTPGYFRLALDVYGRGHEPCPGCGRALREIRVGQRSTVFCPDCQH